MSDEPDEFIRRGVERSNPRRPGESAADWRERLSAITSKAVRRYWGDIRSIQDESGVDTDEARRLYREALDSLDADRSETTRPEIVRIVSESLKEEEVPTVPTGERVIWAGDEFTFRLMDNYAATINARLPGGLHTYGATLWVYRGGVLIGSDEVLFEATPSELWTNFHDEARDYFMSAAYPKRGNASVTFHVTEIRVVE